jgi:hypothetical protein
VTSEIPPTSEPGIGTLLGGVIRDGQTLLKQQLELFRSEVKHEVRQFRSGVVSICIGAGIAATGAIFLFAMLAHLLHTFTEIPLWGCYGIVGGALALIGGGILMGGRKSVADVHLAPPPITARALKENIEWVTKRKTPEPTA